MINNSNTNDIGTDAGNGTSIDTRADTGFATGIDTTAATGFATGIDTTAATGSSTGTDTGSATGVAVDTDAVIDSGTDAGIAIVTDAGIAIGTDAGIAIGTDAGIAIGSDATGTDDGIGIGTDAGITIVTDAGIGIGTDAGIAIGTNAGIAIGTNANIAIGTEADITIGTDIDIAIGSYATGTDAGITTDTVFATGTNTHITNDSHTGIETGTDSGITNGTDTNVATGTGTDNATAAHYGTTFLQLRNFCIIQQMPLPSIEIINRGGSLNARVFIAKCSVSTVQRLGKATTKWEAGEKAAIALYNVIRSMYESNKKDGIPINVESQRRRVYKTYEQLIEAGATESNAVKVCNLHYYFTNYYPHLKKAAFEVIESEEYTSDKDKAMDLIKALKLEAKVTEFESDVDNEPLFCIQLNSQLDSIFLNFEAEIYKEIISFFKIMLN